jgi:hypothetical protein
MPVLAFFALAFRERAQTSGAAETFAYNSPVQSRPEIVCLAHESARVNRQAWLLEEVGQVDEVVESVA